MGGQGIRARADEAVRNPGHGVMGPAGATSSHLRRDVLETRVESMKRGSEEQHGFTLIELLVSLTIFSVIALAVYSVFAAGVGAWRKAQEFSSTYQTARLVLDDLAQELTNAVNISGTDFVGEPQRLSLLTVRQRPYAQGRPADPKITRVTYEVRRDRASATYSRSEERRVGKECRSRWSPYH